MELKDVIFKRRTVRDFSEKAVEPEIIRKALESGLRAPSYNHMKEWDFFIEVAAIIPFGYKGDNVKIIPQKEVNLEEKIHYNKW